MKHSVDPTVDCVFKAILGSNEHINLLLNFLNSVCQNDILHPITGLTIINPYNEKEFLTDKMSIVDVKADNKTSLPRFTLKLKGRVGTFEITVVRLSATKIYIGGGKRGWKIWGAYLPAVGK